MGFWFFPPRRWEPGARLVSPQENSPIWSKNILIFSMFDDEQIQSELLSKQVTSISQLDWSWCWHWDAINKHVTKLLHSGSSQHHPGQFVSTCYSAPPHTHTLTDITYLFICFWKQGPSIKIEGSSTSVIFSGPRCGLNFDLVSLIIWIWWQLEIFE